MDYVASKLDSFLLGSGLETTNNKKYCYFPSCT